MGIAGKKNRLAKKKQKAKLSLRFLDKGRNPLKESTKRARAKRAKRLAEPILFGLVPATTQACQSATQGVAIDESERIHPCRPGDLVEMFGILMIEKGQTS